jgi:toxin ParE1/3/4
MSSSNKQIFRSRAADDDLLAIWQFGAQEWSPEMADRHLRELDDICARLLDEPKLGRKRDDLIPGIRSMVVRPHVVFYRLAPTGIFIVRVLHQRLDLETLFRR